MKRYLIVINILLITTAVYLSVKAFYKTVTAKVQINEVSTKPIQSNSGPDNEKQQPLAAYKIITERNLFKTKKRGEQKPDAINFEMLKQTELKLKLWGTVTGDRKIVYAVIEDGQSRQQNLYKTGDSIQNATIKMILRTKVILSVNGKDEILQMEDFSNHKKAGRLSKRRLPSAPGTHSTQSNQRISLERNQIEDAFKDINNIMKDIKIRPYLTEGKPDGLILSSINPRSIFRKMGLRNGDILTGVDGEKIESVDNALEFYEKLKLSSKIALQIKRRGQLKTIEYNIK
ncbi:MAG: PDZ domain-containing protein [Desulfobacterales bacterium]|nr:PDZ domain-containing protein [Desulfobacterales bacterium]